MSNSTVASTVNGTRDAVTKPVRLRASMFRQKLAFRWLEGTSPESKQACVTQSNDPSVTPLGQRRVAVS